MDANAPQAAPNTRPAPAALGAPPVGGAAPAYAPPPSEGAPPSDGRVARSRRTVDQIVEALLELVERDGHLRPTAHQVARRAGVSRRGLYLHFESLEDLFAAAADRRARQVQASWQPPPGEGPLDQRISWFCGRWAPILEALIPLRRAAAVHEPFSHQVAATAARTRRWARDTVEDSFEHEVAAVPDDERPALVTALHQATSCSAWDEQRRHGHDIEEAAEGMQRLLRALLADAIDDMRHAS